MSRLVAALDQGTTSTRCLIFDESGDLRARAQAEHAQIFPAPGWVEHDPMEVLARSRQVIGEALGLAGLKPSDLSALGITNQRETTLAWDPRTGRPLYNAIVWQDTRTEALCASLAQDGSRDRFRAMTGLPLSTYFSGPKMRWLLDALPGLREAGERGEACFGTIDSWLIWNLSGGPDGGAHVTDVTNASRTQLMNLQTLAWDPSILEAMDIPVTMLPRILPSSLSQGYGRTKDGVPICAALGDQQAALVGQACFEPGSAKNTYGTGCFLLLNTGANPVASSHGLLTTLAYQFGDAPPAYALEGSVAMAGATVQWLRDNLGILDTVADVEALAAQVEDAGGMVLVPAFSGLFAPHWRPDARGVMVGLSRFIDKRHVCYAALEATAFQTRELVEAMEADAGLVLRKLWVDGGMTRNGLLMQMQADLLGVPVQRAALAETTAWGAAYAAGRAAGIWDAPPSSSSSAAVAGASRGWEPRMSAARRDARMRVWRSALERSLDWELPS